MVIEFSEEQSAAGTKMSAVVVVLVKAVRERLVRQIEQHPSYIVFAFLSSSHDGRKHTAFV